MAVRKIVCDNPKCVDDRGRRTKVYITGPDTVLGQMPRFGNCGCKKVANGKEA